MKVGIIGAGTMGSGIAQAFAQTEGYEVMLCDINETFAANGKKKIAAGFEKRIAKGKMTQEEADKVLNKITMFGALYLSVVAIAPIITGNIFGYHSLAIGGTSVISVVGVALETVKQMEAQMLMRHYKGFLE